MTVSELIGDLKKYPAEAIVLVRHHGDYFPMNEEVRGVIDRDLFTWSNEYPYNTKFLCINDRITE